MCIWQYLPENAIPGHKSEGKKIKQRRKESKYRSAGQSQPQGHKES